MSKRPITNVRMLVVEDKPKARDLLLLYLNSLDEIVRTNIGIGEVSIDAANAVVNAKQSLMAAASPYDLVLLDLRLPKESPDDGTEDISNGQDLLEFILSSRSARGVVVVSAYGDYQFVRDALKAGAIDFVRKPVDQVTFESVVLNALVRLMTQETERLLHQRVFDLIAHSQLGLAHGFRQVFFTLLKGVTVAAEGFERDARDRFGVDSAKDPADSLALLFNAHREAIEKAREDWAAIQAELAPASSAFDTANVSEMLQSIKARLEPALVVKRVLVTENNVFDRPVHTFEKDVEVVLGEIIAGALSEIKDPAKVHKIKLSFKVEDTRVGVVFEDDLDPIPEKHARVINEGLRIITDANFGRAWGLSVAKHVALRGGGEIEVATKHGKNVVTYYIPLADHA